MSFFTDQDVSLYFVHPRRYLSHGRSYLVLHCDRYEASLAQEFIVLLIRLCAERGFCGLSPVEALRRELVQRLAVGDATHSSLIKALPRRLINSKHLDECLNSVAVYRNPSGMQQVCSGARPYRLSSRAAQY